MAAMGVFLIFLGGKRQFAGSKVFTGLQSSVVTIYPPFSKIPSCLYNVNYFLNDEFNKCMII